MVVMMTPGGFYSGGEKKVQRKGKEERTKEMKRDPFFFASLRLLLRWVSAYVSALLCERAEAVKEESERERRGKSRTATKLFEKREVGSVKLTLFFFALFAG